MKILRPEGQEFERRSVDEMQEDVDGESEEVDERIDA